MVRTVTERISELTWRPEATLAPVIVKFSAPLLECLCNALQKSPAEQQAAVIDTLTAWLQEISELNGNSRASPFPVSTTFHPFELALDLLDLLQSVYSEREQAAECVCGPMLLQ
jgi:hypothetical protein